MPRPSASRVAHRYLSGSVWEDEQDELEDLRRFRREEAEYEERERQKEEREQARGWHEIVSWHVRGAANRANMAYLYQSTKSRRFRLVIGDYSNYSKKRVSVTAYLLDMDTEGGRDGSKRRRSVPDDEEEAFATKYQIPRWEDAFRWANDEVQRYLKNQ